MYTLVNNTSQRNLLDELISSIEDCNRFYFNVAFVSFSGVQLLLDSLDKAFKGGVTGRMITGTYLNFTDPKAIRRLNDFDDLNIRIYPATERVGFHPKAYIFEYEDYYKVIVGSSNLTNYALKSNVEWNLEVIAKTDESNQDFLTYLNESFDQIWNQSHVLTEEFLIEYEKHYRKLKYRNVVEDSQQIFTFPLERRLTPNSMQIQAVRELSLLREAGAKRALAVAATGTGKTYMAAFDVQRAKPKKMLFLVHREMILEKAKESFAKVVDVPKNKMGLLTGNQKNYEADYLFATIQTMARECDHYDPEEFDYIVIDEAHRSTSPTYTKVLNHFKPKFLLGMTATPERMDHGNVYDVFDNHVAIEVRLREALEEGLLVPFHYYGITDQMEVDLSDKKLSPDEIAEKLNITSRVDYIIDHMNFYSFDGTKRKALGFCITKKHAQFMAEEFTKRGIPSSCLTGEDSEEERMRQIKLLESETDRLNVIFTVDIFNEGIDIPSVNTVLMLRPTESPIIFTQQLGRGLRKAEQKEFLTVLDFIGNYSKSFLIALALYGSQSVSKKKIRRAVQSGFRTIPGPSNVRMDEIAKEQILQQLEQENFYSFRYLKEAYESFKKSIGSRGKIPFKLQDYLGVEGAPDPVLFFSKSIHNKNSNNYYKFLNRVEKNHSFIQEMVSKEAFMKVYSQLSDLLPLKRPHEMAILELSLSKTSFSFDEAVKQVGLYCDGDQLVSTLHALETFQLLYASGAERKEMQVIQKESDNQYRFHEELISFLKNETYKEILSDLIHYGLNRYKEEFGRVDYGTPFLKVHEEYTLREVALVTNYRKPHSAFRDSTQQNEAGGDSYYLFNTLHKDENIDDSIRYKDNFVSREQFQWESKNSTGTDSETGKDLIDNVNRGKTIHIFVRKYKAVNGIVQRYTYMGTADAISYRNEKPIEIQYHLHHKMPFELYQEFEPEKVSF